MAIGFNLLEIKKNQSRQHASGHIYSFDLLHAETLSELFLTSKVGKYYKILFYRGELEMLVPYRHALDISTDLGIVF